eukprot:CAMPEP_0179462414 /NCGR_PEP_ID=MMETSP0799-20121207/44785_1 /TAXON_ID=46947 /ORGANISM="Geminigera cryophila, Strain CCMP2564" /LENGTH=94 /DNA_ID=CAMNT_0021265283 /DNA_START=465 /DNA_END=750 /DNA_ORIENTATION=+
MQQMEASLPFNLCSTGKKCFSAEQRDEDDDEEEKEQEKEEEKEAEGEDPRGGEEMTGWLRKDKCRGGWWSGKHLACVISSPANLSKSAHIAHTW